MPSFTRQAANFEPVPVALWQHEACSVRTAARRGAARRRRRARRGCSMDLIAMRPGGLAGRDHSTKPSVTMPRHDGTEPGSLSPDAPLCASPVTKVRSTDEQRVSRCPSPAHCGTQAAMISPRAGRNLAVTV